MLLRDYGGTWLDATTYLTGDIPQYVFDAELFAPLEMVLSDDQVKDFFDCRNHTVINNYFLSTNAPHSRFFQCMAEFLIEAWSNMDGMPYLSWFGFASIASEEDPEISKIMYNLYNNKNRVHSYNFFALFKSFDSVFDKKKWEEIKKFPIQKFSASSTIQRSSGKVKSDTFLDKLLKGELN